MLLRFFLIVLISLPFGARANENDRLVRLHADKVLVETGLLGYILPRFSLKTQVRVEQVGDAAQADLLLGDTGHALFEGGGQVWHMEVRRADHPGTERLATWLRSDIGARTITGFAPGGTALFSLPKVAAAQTAEVAVNGDALRGHDVSRAKCTRCHAVDAATRGGGIGSTPSFAVVRSMSDWEARFAGFYTLNPHPAFTQITGVTQPFPPERPSPIAPIELSLDELEALLAYVAGMPPADLGDPLEHQ